MMEILFVATFYFTILRALTHTHLFNNWCLTNWDEVLGTDNWSSWLRIPIVCINWTMWFYQIWFWMTHFKICPT